MLKPVLLEYTSSEEEALKGVNLVLGVASELLGDQEFKRLRSAVAKHLSEA